MKLYVVILLLVDNMTWEGFFFFFGLPRSDHGGTSFASICSTVDWLNPTLAQNPAPSVISRHDKCLVV